MPRDVLHPKVPLHLALCFTTTLFFCLISIQALSVVYNGKLCCASRLGSFTLRTYSSDFDSILNIFQLPYSKLPWVLPYDPVLVPRSLEQALHSRPRRNTVVGNVVSIGFVQDYYPHLTHSSVNWYPISSHDSRFLCHQWDLSALTTWAIPTLYDTTVVLPLRKFNAFLPNSSSLRETSPCGLSYTSPLVLWRGDEEYRVATPLDKPKPSGRSVPRRGGAGRRCNNYELLVVME